MPIPAPAQVPRARATSSTAPASPRRSARRAMPGPTLEAEVGDTIVVHFRNGDDALRPGASRCTRTACSYKPDYDGAYLGDFTRAGGFIAPGEEFTYTWEATPDSVGVWPYHDHGPNHTINTPAACSARSIVREKGAKAPDVEQVLVLHQLAAAGDRPAAELFQCINGRAFAGNTPTIRAKVGQDVAIHVIGGDDDVPHLPRPRPPLAGRRRRVRGQPDVGPERGRSPPAGRRTTRAAGSTTAMSSPTRTPAWPAGTWSNHEQEESEIRIDRTSLAPSRRSLAGRGRARDAPRTTRRRQTRQACRRRRKGPHHTLKVCEQGPEGLLQDDPGGGQRRQGRRHDQACANGTYKRGRARSPAPKKRYLKLIGNVKHPAKVVLERKGSGRREGSERRATSTAPTRSRVERLPGPALQGQRLLRRQRRRATSSTTTSREVRAASTASTRSTPRAATMTRLDVGAWNNDAGFYIGQTPKQTKPTRTIVTNVEVVRQRARLVRHEHALRDDHQVAVLQQRHRASSRTRWTSRSSRRRRTT